MITVRVYLLKNGLWRTVAIFPPQVIHIRWGGQWSLNKTLLCIRHKPSFEHWFPLISPWIHDYTAHGRPRKESNERKTGTFDIPSDGTDGRDLVSQSHGQIVDICRVSCTLVNYPQANYCGSIIKTSQLAHLSKRYFLTQLVLQAHSCHAEEALLCSLTPIYLQNMVHRWCRRCYNKARFRLETALLPLCLKLS